MCDRIAIIDEGKILLSGNTEELRSTLHAQQNYRLLIRGDVSTAESVMTNLNYVKSYESEVDTIILEIEDPMDNNAKLLRALLDAGVNVIELAEDEATLEDLYLEVVKGGSQ
jgi:ABC-type multidrug transport system ATPase subunit